MDISDLEERIRWWVAIYVSESTRHFKNRGEYEKFSEEQYRIADEIRKRLRGEE